MEAVPDWPLTALWVIFLAATSSAMLPGATSILVPSADEFAVNGVNEQLSVPSETATYSGLTSSRAPAGYKMGTNVVVRWQSWIRSKRLSRAPGRLGSRGGLRAEH